ncbi:MAG: hypothetical protein ACP5N2_03390 [Candidatus Nanoarchaeia archaeon]
MRILGEKKGVMFFTVDALIAGIIFVLTVALLLSFLLNTPESLDAKYYVDGYADYITSTRMSQYNGVYNFVYYDPQEPNPDTFVYEKILLMKSKETHSDATIESFVHNFTLLVIPEHVGIEYKIDNTVIYSRHTQRINKSDVFLSTSIFTFVTDENNVMYGPNVTKITVWV